MILIKLSHNVKAVLYPIYRGIPCVYGVGLLLYGVVDCLSDKSRLLYFWPGIEKRNSSLN